MIRQEVSRAAEELGDETFEEADDFDIEDDPVDPRTPYEAVFNPRPLQAPPAEPVKAVGKPPLSVFAFVE
jgi:hypothetical protein